MHRSTKLWLVAGGFGAIGVMTLSDAFPNLLWRLTERFEFLDSGGVSPILDAGHAVTWGALTVAIALVLRSWTARVLAAVAMIAVGFGLEAVQGVVTSSRTGSWADVEANVVGICFGLLVAAGIIATRRISDVGQR